MNSRHTRGVALVCGAILLAASAAACISTEQPTPIYIVVTPTPAPSEVVTPPPSEAVTPAPSEVATPADSFTPWPSLSPTPESTPVPTVTETPTPPAGVTPSPPAGGCVGAVSEANRMFFVDAANGLKFTVYCGFGWSGWGLASSPQSTWSGGSHGNIIIRYQYKKTSSRIEVCEGTIPSGECEGDTGSLGSASFGPLSGTLYSTSDGFAVRVAPGTSQAYTIIGHNVTQTTVVTYATRMAAVK